MSRVDQDACIACGVCEDRCPVAAIAVEADVAAVDTAKCLGCGACTPTCDAEAVRLVLREEIKSPPSISEFLEARKK